MYMYIYIYVCVYIYTYIRFTYEGNWYRNHILSSSTIKIEKVQFVFL